MADRPLDGPKVISDRSSVEKSLFEKCGHRDGAGDRFIDDARVKDGVRARDD